MNAIRILVNVDNRYSLLIKYHNIQCHRRAENKKKQNRGFGFGKWQERTTRPWMTLRKGTVIVKMDREQRSMIQLGNVVERVTRSISLQFISIIMQKH